MAKTTRGDRVKLALGRILQDEELQGHLRTGATRLREAWDRGSTRRPSKAVEDKKLYAKVREGATSLTRAGRSLRREPEPPKRRGRKVTIVLVSAGGAAYVLKKRRARKTGPEADSPVASAPVPTEREGQQTAAGRTG
jgi:hypothetical protein